MLLQVHDELLFEVADGEREQVEALVRDKMGGAYPLDVPLEVSVGTAAAGMPPHTSQRSQRGVVSGQLAISCEDAETTGGLMYTGAHVQNRPNQPAFIMASTGEAVTYAELDARSNRLAHYLRSLGLKRLDHYSIFMENNARYLECCGPASDPGCTSPASTRS